MTGKKDKEALAERPRVFMTGASGGMGMASLKQMLPDVGDKYELVVLVRDSKKNRAEMAPFEGTSGLEVVWGDLDDDAAVRRCLLGTSLVLHIAAFVSRSTSWGRTRPPPLSTLGPSPRRATVCRPSTGDA